MGFKTDWRSDSPQAAHSYIGMLQWVQWGSINSAQHVCTLNIVISSDNHKAFHDKVQHYNNMCFSDAFDLQYGVCVLRMREGLDVSHPSQSHGESFNCQFVRRYGGKSCPRLSIIIWATDSKWIHTINSSVFISVNAGFDGGPESINTISAPSRIQTRTTCMYMHDQMISIDFFYNILYIKKSSVNRFWVPV